MVFNSTMGRYSSLNLDAEPYPWKDAKIGSVTPTGDIIFSAEIGEAYGLSRTINVFWRVYIPGSQSSKHPLMSTEFIPDLIPVVCLM